MEEARSRRSQHALCLVFAGDAVLFCAAGKQNLVPYAGSYYMETGLQPLRISSKKSIIDDFEELGNGFDDVLRDL